MLAGVSREFTLDEARATLALLREALEALQRVQRRLRAVRDELRALGRRHLNDGVVGERELRALRAEQVRLAEDAQRSAAQIRDAGVELKSIADGLLDFPTHVDGVPAYWCWRAGEADIGWWHPRASGFASRRPIA